MAFKAGKLAQITVATKSLDLFLSSAGIALKADTSDTTTFTLTAHTFIAGLIGGQLSIDGYYDPTVTTGAPSVLATNFTAAAAVACVFYPAGNNAGQGTSHTFSAIITDYSEDANVNDRVNIHATLLLTGTDTIAQL